MLFGSVLRDDLCPDSDVDLNTLQDLSRYFCDEVAARAAILFG